MHFTFLHGTKLLPHEAILAFLRPGNRFLFFPLNTDFNPLIWFHYPLMWLYPALEKLKGKAFDLYFVDTGEPQKDFE